MIQIRPHHLLDILRDYGNEIKRSPHPYGASVKNVTDQLLEDIDQNIILVSRIDSICITCSKLVNGICQARINDKILMRKYNDHLDDTLFNIMGVAPDTELSIKSVLVIVKQNMVSLLSQFNSPTNNPEIRKTGTLKAMKKLCV